MTVSEAMTQWKIGKDKMINYLNDGIIPGITVTNGIIDIPDFGVPLVPPSNAKITSESVIKYILKALKDLQFINYRILKIEKSVFETVIHRLEQDGDIEKLHDVSEPDYSSVSDFIITDKGTERLKKKKFSIDELTANINFVYKNISGDISVKIKPE